MPGYPNLFPTGFVEYEKDSCEGPILYRSQPSRETPGITQLNEVISKYGSSQYLGGDFMRLSRGLKDISRMWDRLPQVGKDDFMKLMLDTNTGMSKDIYNKLEKKVKFNDRVEYFGEDGDQESVEVKNESNKMNILIIIVVAIVAIIIGFLIACTSSNL